MSEAKDTQPEEKRAEDATPEAPKAVPPHRRAPKKPLAAGAEAAAEPPISAAAETPAPPAAQAPEAVQAAPQAPPAPPPVEEPSANEVKISAQQLEAELEQAEGLAPRRVRSSRKVETPAEAGAEAAGAEAAAVDSAAPAPRLRPPAPARERPARPEREARPPRPQRERPRREPRPRGEARPGAPAVVGQAQPRKIYRQDVPGQPAGAPSPAPRAEARPAASAGPAAPTPQRAGAPASTKGLDGKDKLTLILHPAPKAARFVAKKKDRPMTAKEALRAKLAKRTGPGEAASAPSAPTPAAPVELDAALRQADADGAVDALRAAGAQGEALVKAWLEDGNVAAIAAVARNDVSEPRARKQARRALNVLRSRGVEVPRLEGPSPLKSDEPGEVVALFIPPDGTAASFVSLSQRQPGGRHHVADIVVRAGLGVVHANSARLAGKHIRGWQNRVEEQYGAKPVQVPLAWARHVVAEARKRNEQSGQLVPLGFDRCAELLQPAPAEPPAHPLATLDADEPSSDDLTAAAAGSDALHTEPEFRGWFPDRRALDEFLVKVGERLGEDNAGNATAVSDALRLEVTAATDRYFTPERREPLADRMRDAAISLRARRGDAAARRVLHLARAIRQAGLITSPPSEIPFLVGYFQKAVQLMVQQGGGQLRVPIPRKE
jgi:hypothetical protein